MDYFLGRYNYYLRVLVEKIMVYIRFLKNNRKK